MNKKLGILGVGHLASYLVAGLRASGDSREINLSPRNAQSSEALAREFGCSVATSNQEVIDAADVILLSVRPDQVETLLTGLVFPTEKIVLSCIAGVEIKALEKFVQADLLVRSLPLACAEIGQGAVPLYPANPLIERMLSGLGVVVVLDDESEFELASVAACMNGWMYEFFATMTDWYIQKGVNPERARELVVRSCQGAAALAAERPEQSLRGISESIATEGTYTRIGLDKLEEKNAFDLWNEAAEVVYSKLKH